MRTAADNFGPALPCKAPRMFARQPVELLFALSVAPALRPQPGQNLVAMVAPFLPARISAVSPSLRKRALIAGLSGRRCPPPCLPAIVATVAMVLWPCHLRASRVGYRERAPAAGCGARLFVQDTESVVSVLLLAIRYAEHLLAVRLERRTALRAYALDGRRVDISRIA